MDFVPWLVVATIAFAFLIFVLNSVAFTIHTKQATIAERFGKFERIAGPGLNFKMPVAGKEQSI